MTPLAAITALCLLVSLDEPAAEQSARVFVVGDRAELPKEFRQVDRSLWIKPAGVLCDLRDREVASEKLKSLVQKGAKDGQVYLFLDVSKEDKVTSTDIAKCIRKIRGDCKVEGQLVVYIISEKFEFK